MHSSKDTYVIPSTCVLTVSQLLHNYFSAYACVFYLLLRRLHEAAGGNPRPWKGYEPLQVHSLTGESVPSAEQQLEIHPGAREGAELRLRAAPADP